MRIIKFRGKRIDNNEWIYGFLLKTVDDKKSYIKRGVATFPFEVKSETVGQFAGFKGYIGDYTNSDKNRNEVELFDGDIVEAMSEGSKGTFVIKFRQGPHPGWILFPAWQGGKMWSIHASDLARAKGDYYDSLKKIGNIHDNPELLPQTENSKQQTS